MLNISTCSKIPDYIKFIILVSCPPVNDEIIKPIVEILNKQNQLLPSLHISGINDTLVRLEMSETVFRYFNQFLAEFYLHKGGYYCPSDSGFRQKLKDFIQRANNL